MQKIRDTLSRAYMLLTQRDVLVTEEGHARYKLHMFRAMGNTAQESQAELEQQRKEWEILQLEKLIEHMTGLTVDTLRERTQELELVMGEVDTLQKALRTLHHLGPERRYAMLRHESQEVVEEEAMETATEAAFMEDSCKRLTEKAMTLAEGIQYRMPSALVPVRIAAP